MKNLKICIVAPSLAPSVSKASVYAVAEQNLNELEATVCWAPNALRALKAQSKDDFLSTSAQDRLEDFEWAAASDCSIILTALGGFNCYQLLGSVQFEELCKQKKTIVGHSDPTLLLNANFARTGQVGWYGPNFRNLGDAVTGKISAKNMLAAVTSPEVQWTPGTVYKNSFKEPARTVRNWSVIQQGTAQGTGIGGNIGSFFLLQGTQYMPRFNKPTILFLEEDEMPGKFTVEEFDRRLRSIFDQPKAAQHIRGLIIGRFLDECEVTLPRLKRMLADIPALQGKPVLANVEIGHGMPRIMLPIGGKIFLDTYNKQIKVSGDSKQIWQN